MFQQKVQVSLGKPSLRLRLEAYYTLIAPDGVIFSIHLSIYNKKRQITCHHLAIALESDGAPTSPPEMAARQSLDALRSRRHFYVVVQAPQ
jgi:hypothetical protein